MTSSGERNRHYVCRNCHKQIDISAQPDAPCPDCGSTAKDISIEVEETLESAVFKEQIKGKIKSPGKRKSCLKFIKGEEPSKIPGTPWVEKHRVIDPKNDVYEEKVVDSKTGKVLHDVKERLSDHIGHGSDRK